MVFPGRRSTGCYTCRQRKVKCDSTRAACDRCTRFGRVCPGYPDSFAFKAYRGSRPPLASRWADENDSLAAGSSTFRADADPAEDTAESASGSESTLALAPVTAPVTAPVLVPAVAVAAPAGVYTSIPPYIPTTCTDGSSLSFFFHHHVLIVDKSPCGGHLAFLPDFYREKETEPCLRHAVLSLGYLSLYNIHRSPVFWIQARRHYTAALAALAAAIDTTRSAVRDEVFASALFLSMFADLSNERKIPVNDHIPGINALIQARGSASLTSKYGRRLLAWAFNQLQIQAISNDEYGYAHLPALFEDIERPDSVCRAIRLVSLISGYCQSARAGPRYERHPAYIFHEIATWEEKLPGHWKRQLHDMRQPGNNNSHDEPPPTNTWTACFLALIHSSIFLFYLQCLSHLPLTNMADHDHFMQLYTNDLHARLFEILNIICSAVRSSLGDLDETGTFRPFQDRGINHGVPYNLLWPMSLVARCDFASDDQVLLCTGGLRYAYAAMGRS